MVSTIHASRTYLDVFGYVLLLVVRLEGDGGHAHGVVPHLPVGAMIVH